MLETTKKLRAKLEDRLNGNEFTFERSEVETIALLLHSFEERSKYIAECCKLDDCNKAISRIKSVNG